MKETKNNNLEYIRVQTTKQQKDSYDLWKICFEDTKEYMDNYFAWRLKENEVIALYDDNVMTSMIHLNPYPLMFSKEEIQTNYIVGVATRPDYRKQGLMRNLLTKALRDMYEKGHEFTWLMPASDKIYLPFDFRYIYQQQRRKLTINQEVASTWLDEGEVDELQAATISRIQKYSHHNKAIQTNIQMKVLDNSNINEVTSLLSFVNNILINTQDIFAKRNEHYYKRLQADMKSAGGNVLVMFRNEKVVGCISYMLEGNYAEITEAIITKEYSKDIIKLVAKAIVDQWINNKNPNDEIPLTLTYLESKFIDEKALNEMNFIEEIKPIIMARIVNLQNFMKHVTTKEALSIIIKVEDPVLKGNHNIWELNFKNKISDSYKCKVTITDKKPEVLLDIGTFTEILMGYKRITDLDKKVFSEGVLEKFKKIDFYHKVYLNEIV